MKMDLVLLPIVTLMYFVSVLVSFVHPYVVCAGI